MEKNKTYTNFHRFTSWRFSGRFFVFFLYLKNDLKKPKKWPIFIVFTRIWRLSCRFFVFFADLQERGQKEDKTTWKNQTIDQLSSFLPGFEDSVAVFSSFFPTFEIEGKNTKKRQEKTKKLTYFHRFYQDLKTYETSPKCAYSDDHSNTYILKICQIYTSVICVFSYITAKTLLV